MRSWTYLILAATSTLLFLLLMATLLMVPGIALSTKILMLSVVAIAVSVSLALGTWRFSSTAAPIQASSLGLTMGVVLLLELAYCAVNAVLLATATHL